MSDITEKKTVEQWATEAKLLPRMVEETPKPRNREPRMLPNRDFWKFAAAQAGAGWPVGAEMTKADFDDAIAKFTGHPSHPERVVFGVRDVGEVAKDPKAIERIANQRKEREARDAKIAAEAKAAEAAKKPADDAPKAEGKPAAAAASTETTAAASAAGQR